MKSGKYSIIFTLCFLGIFLVCCNKKQTKKYAGVVLTRYDNPAPNAKLTFYAIQTSMINGKTTGGNYYFTTTDANGKFDAEFDMYRKEYVHELHVISDSGGVNYGSVSPGKDITIRFN